MAPSWSITSRRCVHYVSVLTMMILLGILDVKAASKKAGFFFDYIGSDYTILRLRCHVGPMSPSEVVMSIAIFNATSRSEMSRMAWISRGRQAELLSTPNQGSLFVAGTMSEDNYDPDHLEILITEYNSHADRKFGCNITKSKQGATYQVSWMIVVNKTVPNKAVSTTPHPSYTEAPYLVGAVKDKEVETDSLPMTVLIVMLVLISILLFLAMFLLLHRYRTYRRPPSTNSSVKVPYIQPQDAIGQESSEDGEIATASSATPRVRYKSTRESPSRQNSPLYACVPVSSTDE